MRQADRDYTDEPQSQPSAAATLIGAVSIVAIIFASVYLIVKGVNINALFIVLISGAVFAWFGLGIAIMARGLIQGRASDVVYGFATSASAIIVPYLLL